MSNCSSNHLLKGYFCSTELLQHPCLKSVGHSCVALLLHSPFDPWICVSIPLLIPHGQTCSHCSYINLQIWWIDTSHFTLFQNCFSYSNSLPIYVNINLFYIYKKNLAGILIGIIFKLYYQFLEK